MANGGGEWVEGGWRGVLWGVIEFLSSPALSGLRLSVWLSVLGAERQVESGETVLPRRKLAGAAVAGLPRCS